MTLPQAISRPPESPLQRAVVALLRADPTLTGLLASVKGSAPPIPAVVDEVREGQPKPYVQIGDHLSTPGGDLSRFGRIVTMTLHVWTKAGSMGPGQAIADAVARLLDRQDRALSVLLAASGHRCVRIEFQFSQALKDPDPEIRHHTVRFRVEITQLT